MNRIQLIVATLFAIPAMSVMAQQPCGRDLSESRAATTLELNSASNYFDLKTNIVARPDWSVAAPDNEEVKAPFVEKAAPTAGATLYGIAKIAGQTNIISTTVGTASAIETKKVGSATYLGGVYINGRFYVVSNFVNVVFPTEIYDTESWAVVGSGPTFSSDPYIVSLTHDAVNDVVYGCFTEVGESNFYFCTLNMQTGEKKQIAKFTQRFVAIACDKEGTIYGIAIDGNLYKINKASGATTLVGSTGVKPGIFLQEACFDADNGQLYWVYGPTVYIVDTQLGTATKTGTINAAISEWMGLFTRPAKAEQMPSWVNSMKINFTDASLSGTVTFSMPTVDANGGAMSGTLKYVVEVDGREKASGEALTGEPVKASMTLEEGKHSFKVYAVSGAIKGLESSLDYFVGHDNPATPAGVSVSETTPGNVTVSWSAVGGGANDGFINKSNLKYDVVRQPGNVSIAKSTTNTTVVDTQIDSFGKYSYEITASDGTKQSAVASSGVKVLGEALGIKPPYTYQFDEPGGFGFFTANNANNDDYSWAYDANMGLLWCQASPSVESDDWLFSPAIRVEANQNYNLKLDLSGSNRMEVERIEIKYGSSPDPSAMSTVILKPTEFVWKLPVNVWFEAKTSGLINIGLHMVTKACDGALAISKFELSKPISSYSPATASSVKATAAPLAAKKATVSFVTPSKSFNGSTLSSISKAKVMNKTTGKTLEVDNPGVGASLTVTDNEPADGNNTYEVVCENSYGSSLGVESTCWVGLDFAGAPSNVTWQSVDGKKLKLTWDVPTAGEHGGYVDFDKLTYAVVRYENKTLVAEKIAGTSVEIEPEFENVQDLVSFGVCGVNDQGMGVFGLSNQSAFGTPYSAPLYESFENVGFHSYPWVVKQVAGPNVCNILTEVAGMPISSLDDNAMAVFTMIKAGRTRLETPLVDISGLKNPALRFWCYFVDDNTVFEIKANNTSGLQWQTVATESYNENKRGWHLVTADLSAFKGETHLQLGIEAYVAKDPAYITYAMLDKVSVEDRAVCDLMVSGISAPREIVAGKDFTAVVKVTNAGSSTVEAYSIELSTNGQVVAIQQCGPIAPDEVAEVAIPAELSSNATSLELKAAVVLAADEVPENNIGVAKSIKVVKSRYPQPTHLVNNATDNGKASLTWEAPSMTYQATSTDNLESYEHGSVGGIDVTYDYTDKKMVINQTEGAIGDYKLVDGDKQLTASVVVTVGRLPHSSDGMVCQVIDIEAANLKGNSSIWAAHSDNKLFCFWQSRTFDDYYDTPNDDYLILPELAEDAPSISFWAKSLTDKYGLEQFEIMVSTKSDAIDDFVVYESVKNVPAGYATSLEGGYTFYEFDLPEGTRYAAIHYNAAGTMALLVDDITFTPANGVTELELVGYNVYRDGVRVNKEVVKDTHFEDTFYGEAPARYNVTALFTVGESRYSNTVSAKGGLTAAEMVGADGDGRILTDGGEIVIDGFVGIPGAIYRPDGRLVARIASTEEETRRVSVASGIYIVEVGSVAKSVIVK